MSPARVIAIDGPAASGKSSTARAVAERLGFLHVDSGALYRGLARVALDLGTLTDAESILASARARGLRYTREGGEAEVLLDGAPAEPLIRSPDVTRAVSPVSALPALREWVNARLRMLLGGAPGLVLDGRDIGTVVFPDAALKIYLVADPAVRARRRIAQRSGEAGVEALVEEETRQLRERDAADASRPVAPLRPADDAVQIDTSTLGFGEQVAAILALAHARLGLPTPGSG